MWKLLYRVEGLGPLRETFQAHVEKSGVESVARASAGLIEEPGAAEQKSVVRFR
jgi:hypothetical protein